MYQKGEKNEIKLDNKNCPKTVISRNVGSAEKNAPISLRQPSKQKFDWFNKSDFKSAV